MEVPTSQIVFLVGSLIVSMLVTAFLLMRHFDRRFKSVLKPQLPAEERQSAGPPVESADILRKIDKMILSNLAFDYIAEELVNLLPGHAGLLGGALLTIDQDSGELRVAAVTGSLSKANQSSLSRLKGTAVTPEQMARLNSHIIQSLNERRVVPGEQLRDYVCPPYEAEEADSIQERLDIKSVFAYPLIVENRLNGSLVFYMGKQLEQVSQSDEETMQSITDEVAIALANAQLLRQLENINAKLEDANAHLHQMDEMKDEFISIASHQLRSPLTAIKGYTSMLLDSDFGGVPEEQKPILNQVKQSTNEVINLINDMLSVSRINAQKFELTTAPVNLEEIITDVANELKPLAVVKSLDLVLNLPAEPLGELSLDPLRIRQVLINYVDNAIKYTEKGRIYVKLWTEGSDIVFTVSDSGIGIPAGEVEKMFTKFYRAENARQMVTAGSGLGLFVAKRIIEDHHGTPIIESVEGKGSTFGFRLPMAAVTVSHNSTPTVPNAKPIAR